MTNDEILVGRQEDIALRAYPILTPFLDGLDVLVLIVNANYLCSVDHPLGSSYLAFEDIIQNDGQGVKGP